MNSLPCPSLGYCFLFLCILSPYSPANTAGKIVDKQLGTIMNGRGWVCIAQEHVAMLQGGYTRCLQRVMNCPEQNVDTAVSVGNSVRSTQIAMGASVMSSVSECFIAGNSWQEFGQESRASSWSRPRCLLCWLLQ